MKINETIIEVAQADITRLDVDAIVNPANTELQMGGGLAGIIKKRGGQSIEAEAMRKGPLEKGAAIWTKAGALKAKYVIHSATMAMDFQTTEHIIRRAAASALACANELKIDSLAFPALGCGVGGFPKVGAAKIMAQEVLKFLRTRSTTLRRIVFCLYDEPTYKIFFQHVNGYLEHILNNLGKGPYVTVDIIIELPEGIILIERSNPPYGWALPGGFVDYGETVEAAATREAKEETNVDLAEVRQLHTYSDPSRDPRFHTIAVVFVGKGKGKPRFGDDAKGLKIVKYDDLLRQEYSFDHRQIVEDYLGMKKQGVWH